MTLIRNVASVLAGCVLAGCASTQAAPPIGRNSLSLAPALAMSFQEARYDLAPPAPAAPLAPTPAMEVEATSDPGPNSPATQDPKPAQVKASPAKSSPKQQAPRTAASPSKAAEPAKPAGTSVSGKLELVPAGRDGIVAGEAVDGLVYFLPKAGGPPPKPATVSVDTRSKGFAPSVVVVPVGSTLRFPNRDTILHNVFSRTPGTTFDTGFYGPGQVRQQVFAKPGLVTINCSVHHNMRADVVVLATPHYTRPDRNGRYTLTSLPAGPGTLVFWHPRAQAQSVQLSLPTQSVVTRRLQATKPSRHAGMAGH